MARQRITVKEAAEHGIISVEAVRNVIARDQQKHERVDNRCAYNWIQTESGCVVEVEDSDALIASLQEQIADLRLQLDEAYRGKRRIIAALTHRLPALPELTEFSPFPRRNHGTLRGLYGEPWWRSVFGG